MSYKVKQQHFEHIKQSLPQNKDTYLQEFKDEMANNFLNLDISLMHL